MDFSFFCRAEVFFPFIKSSRRGGGVGAAAAFLAALVWQAKPAFDELDLLTQAAQRVHADAIAATAAGAAAPAPGAVPFVSPPAHSYLASSQPALPAVVVFSTAARAAAAPAGRTAREAISS